MNSEQLAEKYSSFKNLEMLFFYLQIYSVAMSKF